MAAVTGNTLVLKPSERDPGAAMTIAELCQRAGLPSGVLNIVHGGVNTLNSITTTQRRHHIVTRMTPHGCSHDDFEDL
ncbi:Aldedh-domain-containing protein [Hymenopellis radicata]|nr:Aldedh-domain-containing protein [Hymenopellis radicata]